MTSELFDLDFALTDIYGLYLIPAIINFGIFSYVFLFCHKSRVNYYFSYFVLFVGLYQIAEGFVKMSLDQSTAIFWSKLALIFIFLMIPFGIQFVIRFGHWQKKIHNIVLLVLFYLPAIFFFVLVEAGYNKAIVLKSETWHWIILPESNFINLVIIIWISLSFLSMITLLWITSYKEKDRMKKHQSLLVAFGLSLPVLMGILFEGILPFIFNTNIPLSVPCLTFFSILTLLAIKKFKLLDYSPKHQWDVIIESMTEGVLIVDDQDRIMYSNTAFSKLLGYSFSELKSKKARELFSNNTENLSLATIIEDRSKYKGKSYQAQLHAKGDKEIWALISGSSFINHNGIPTGTIAVYTDISKIKETKANLEAINKDLEIYVYKASHDLRGPISTMLGLIDIVKFEVNDECALTYFSMLEKSIKKLDYNICEMVKGMNIKGIKTYEDSINFKTMVYEILNSYTYFPGYQRLKIKLEVAISAEFISNGYVIQIILQNIIENAIKYQNYSIPESTLKINISNKHDVFQISIQDNGIGIDNSMQDKVFEMYFRGNDIAHGSGLGLYLVKKAVEKLQGEIKLESIIGEGTVFTITLKSKGIPMMNRLIEAAA